jgi:NADPH:quinone reductase-like Zn-dependent oxidoreductase
MAKALQISRFGGPEVLKLVDLPRKPMVADGVRIKVSAAGVNFADLMMRMGMYPEAPKPPFVPGYEIAGTVLEVGPQVVGFREGDRVLAACKFGGYADEVLLQEYQVRRTPSHLSDAEAAAIPVNFMTAWVALQEMGRVRKGDRVLIPSAAGGVGVAAVQIAAQAGAEVTGLVGSTSKAQTVLNLGAHKIITNAEWETAIDRDAGGYDVILETTGGTSLKRAVRRLARGGRVVNYGVGSFVGGERRNVFKLLGAVAHTPLFTPFALMNSNVGVFGLNMLQIFDPPPPGEDLSRTLLGRAFENVLRGFEEKRFQVVIGKTFPLADGGAAHSHLQSRGNVGKVILACG